MVDKEDAAEHNSFLYFAIPYVMVSGSGENYCVDKNLRTSFLK